MKQPVEEEGGQTAAAITVHLVRWPGLIGPAARILQEDLPRSSDNGPCGTAALFFFFFFGGARVLWSLRREPHHA